jgi:phage terminase large subunit GpA-like protein
LEYFRGLFSEEIQTRTDKKGNIIREYHRKEGQRNEPLDCRVYAFAALQMVAPGLADHGDRSDQSSETDDDDDSNVHT